MKKNALNDCMAANAARDKSIRRKRVLLVTGCEQGREPGENQRKKSACSQELAVSAARERTKGEAEEE